MAWKPSTAYNVYCVANENPKNIEPKVFFRDCVPKETPAESF